MCINMKCVCFIPMYVYVYYIYSSESVETNEFMWGYSEQLGKWIRSTYQSL